MALPQETWERLLNHADRRRDEAVDERDKAIAERDSARNVAVRLEQELAELRRQYGLDS